jgi:hypothetical protein
MTYQLFQARRPASIGALLSFGLKGQKKKFEATFPYPFTDYQRHFLDNMSIFNMLFWGRRAGKDVIAFYAMVKKALETPGKYYYVFPCMKTGKSITVGHDDILKGMCSNYLPRAAVKKVSRSGGFVILLFNGSTIHLVGVGSSQQDISLRGDQIKMVILSEYAYYHRPEQVFNAVVPALTRSKGQLIFASTPCPNSHLVALYEDMKGKRGWYISTVTQKDNHYLTDEEFEHASLAMSKSALELEFNCDYTVPHAHAVFYEQLEEKFTEEGTFKYHETPVFVAMDLGITDSDTVFWWCTQRNGNWIFFDYFEGAGKPFSVYVHELEKRKAKLQYARIFVPHDVVQPEFAHLESRLIHLQRANLPLMRLPKTKVMDSIDRVRIFLEKKNVFFADKCSKGLNHLKNYAYRDAMNTLSDML